MTKCPSCSRAAEPQARYCSYCHTVFPSDTKVAASLRLGEGAPRRWKVPLLVFIAILGAAFVMIDAHDTSAESGSFRAAASDMKRAVIDWVAEYTGFVSPS
jgi:hypothetical protein